MKYRINKTAAVLLAAASLSPAALADKVAPAAKAAPAAKVAPAALQYQYRSARLESMINPNGNRSVAKKYTWLNRRLSITGLINVDGVYASRGWNASSAASAGVVPNHIPGVSHANDISVNNMNVLLDLRINDFTQGHASIVFKDVPGPGPDSTSSSCPGKPKFTVDEGYATLGNMTNPQAPYYLPFYIRVGREYVPFGHYRDPYPLTYSFTQLLSQSNQNVIQLGYVGRKRSANGKQDNLYGSLFAFNGIFSGPGADNVDDDIDDTSTSRVRNWGAKLGYKSNYRTISYELAASYLRDIRDTDFFTNTFKCTDTNSSGPELRRASGVSLYGAARRGAFEVMGNYVSAARTLFFDDSSDLGAETRMWAYTLQGGYRFYTHGARSKVELSYQRTGEMKFAGYNGFTEYTTLMPKWRLQATYRVALGRYTSLVLQYNHTRGYRDVSPDTDNNNMNDISGNEAKARLSVHF